MLVDRWLTCLTVQLLVFLLVGGRLSRSKETVPPTFSYLFLLCRIGAMEGGICRIRTATVARATLFGISATTSRSGISITLTLGFLLMLIHMPHLSPPPFLHT